MLVSIVQQNESALCTLYIPSLLDLPPVQVTTGHQVEFPVWYSMSASVTHFIRSISSAYVSVSISQFLTPPLHLFSTSVSLFPLCKWVHLHHFSRCHMYALNMVFVNIQHLFYTSVSLFLLCKQDDLFHFSKCHTYVLIYDICFSLQNGIFSWAGLVLLLSNWLHKPKKLFPDQN